MYIDIELNKLIDDAASIAGSQRKLAALLDMEQANLAKIKKGERPANWRVRGKLRVILGQEPAHAFVAAVAEDLSTSENADEKKAADGFKAMLAAFPDSWRKRNEPNQRAGLVTRLFLWATEAHSNQAWLHGTQHA